MNKDAYSRMFLKAAEIDFTEEDVAARRTRWWSNIRAGKNGLRLTPKGLLFVQDRANIQTYTIEIAAGFRINPKMVIWLDGYIRSPYYIMYNAETAQYSIIVLTEDAALELMLYAGDLNRLVSAIEVTESRNVKSIRNT